MRFSELMRVVEGRGVVVGELRDGTATLPTQWSDGSGGNDPEVTGVCDDSRKVKPGDVFVARTGTKVEGVKFLVDAMNRGAVAVVSETAVDMEGFASATVENANFALALLAHEVAGNPTEGMKMIGVTGTKGKTTVAYLMRSVLKAAGCVVGMVGTVEIDDGRTVVPAEMTTPGVVELVELFSRMKRNGVTHCVMEVSSHALHQDRVAGIEWTVGMFTNLTGDHLDYHGTMEAYGAAKKRLFEGLGEDATAVVNVDDAWGERMVEGCLAKVVRYRIGTDHAAGEWAADILSLKSVGMEINLNDLPISTPLVGRHNAYNLACVVAAATELTVPPSTIMIALKNNTGAPGRLQPVIGVGAQPGQIPFSVFVDYAHTHDSLENVLTALRATMKGTGSRENFRTWQWDAKFGYNGREDNCGRLICVFGCGGDRDRTKRPKMGRVAQTLADVVIVTSDNPRTEEPGRIIEEVCAGFEEWKEAEQIVVEPDRRAAIQRAIALAEAGDVVLIAGKGHENYQIIGTTKHHFDDVEEAKAALERRLAISK